MFREKTTTFFYVLVGITAALVLVLINYGVLRQNSSLALLSLHLGPSYFAWYVGLTVATASIFGANTAFLTYQVKQYGIQNIFSQSGTGVGALLGIIASSCPVCGTTLLSLIGIVGTLSSLPLQGLELKAIAFAMVLGSFLFSIWWGRRSDFATATCPVPLKNVVTARDHIVLIPLFLLVIVIGYAVATTDSNSTVKAAQASYSCQGGAVK